MKRTLKWVRGLMFENLAWKLLALAVAVVIWALVASEPELATFATVRLEYKNMPEDLEISSEPVDSVVLELRGPSGELRGAGELAHPAVVLDMSSAQAGERTFMIGADNVKMMRGVRLVRAIPSQVRLAFEQRRTLTVPVRVRFSGEGQNGYVVASYEAAPRVLRIVGPRSRVARIAAVVTDPVDVSTTVGTAEFRVNAFMDDPFVRFQQTPQVAVMVTMKKK